MHLPFTPNHVQLISDCYPPQAALLSSGPEYRPNSQELSRLVYYAANKPGKINKLAAELEKRLRVECRRAQSGNIRSRASLLITLTIFKALVTECRRDISLLSSSLISSVLAALSALPSDLELLAKAASVFIAWTTYTDGHLIGVDKNVTQQYLSVLQVFSNLSKFHSGDHEVQNRTRLVGLAALDGVVSSEALFNASPCFKDQASNIVSAVLVTFYQAEFSVLEHEASVIKEKPHSPYLPRARPVAERRAASVHVHTDGDKGPSFCDVVDAALRVHCSLVGQSHGAQIGHIMQAAFDSLDVSQGWKQVEHCRWLAQACADWAQYQYRYAVPTRLIERLLESQDAFSTHTHTTLTAMVTTIFVSPTPLVNLSTSDIVSNLISLVLRRTAIDPEDPLLPALVQTIASLGAHVYYADQIQDLAGELISRLVVVEAGGAGIRGKSSNPKSRCQAIRTLLAGLVGLIHASDGNQPKHTVDMDDQRLLSSISAVAETNNTEQAHKRVYPSRRTKVCPEIWLDTLTLLCDGDYAVRADYAEALVSYLQFEIPKKGDHRGVDGIKRAPSGSEGEAQQAKTTTAILYGDSITRFLNALHAYLYALATSSSLGSGYRPGNPPSPTPLANVDPASINVIPPTPSDSRAGLGEEHASGNGIKEETNGTSNQPDTPPRSESQSRRSTMFGSRSRQVSAFNRLFECFPLSPSSTKFSSPSATLSDYAHVLDLLTLVHEQLPVRALLTGIPMLLALEQAAKGDWGKNANTERLNIVREVSTRVWLVVGKVWDCQEIVEAAEKVLFTMPYPSSLPARNKSKPGVFHPPYEPVEFPRAEASSATDPVNGIDLEQALAALLSNRNVQDVMGLDSSSLFTRLSKKWSPDQALKECVEVHPSPDALRTTSLLKVTPTLMNIDNLSLQSLGRFNRPVGVTDLREALEGRSSMSNPALVHKPASISTLDHAPSVVTQEVIQLGMPQPRSRGNGKQKTRLRGAPGDVRDALDRLGVGSGPRANGRAFKSSFPVQKTESRSRTMALQKY